MSGLKRRAQVAPTDDWPTARVYAALHTCRLAVDENNPWAAIHGAGSALDAVPKVGVREAQTPVLAATVMLRREVAELVNSLMWDAQNVAMHSESALRVGAKSRSACARCLAALVTVREAQDDAGVDRGAEARRVLVAAGRRMNGPRRLDQAKAVA